MSPAHVPMPPEVVAKLVENHARFLGFLQKRTGNRERAEEVLQAALLKGLEKGGRMREAEKVVPWFFRILRNALADDFRRQAVDGKALRRKFLEGELHGEAALERLVCRCLKSLIGTLKPEYAGLLERVDLAGDSLADVAREAGITKNSATVKLHRARRALKEQLVRSCGSCTEHGCLDCACS